MRLAGLPYEVAIAAGICLGAATPVGAATFVYDFDNGQVSGSASPGTPLTSGTGSTLGTVGQDNWVHASGAASSAARNESVAGFTSLWASSPVTTTNGGADNILTRKNDANWSYSIGNAPGVSVGATLRLDSAAFGAGHLNTRAQAALGVDANSDGDIRGTSATAENAEIAFMFGYDSTGPGWYLRPAAFFNYPAGTGSATFNANVSGVWEARVDVDFTGHGGEGSGTLYVRQLFDDAGNAVVDTFHTVDASLTDVNLRIATRMGGVTTGIGGSAFAANPANWDGILIRTAGNGALDNLSITPIPEPSTSTLFIVAAGAVALTRRRKRRAEA
jgi:hypothetical protein